MAEDRQQTTPETGTGSPLRVLQLTAPGRFGGLETVVRQLAIGLTDRGHEVRVVCRLAEDEDPACPPLVSALGAAGVPVNIVQLPTLAFRQVSDRRDADGAVRGHGRHGANRRHSRRRRARPRRLGGVFGPGAWLDAREQIYREVIDGAPGKRLRAKV